jgi:hypothetical protein
MRNTTPDPDAADAVRGVLRHQDGERLEGVGPSILEDVGAAAATAGILEERSCGGDVAILRGGVSHCYQV